MNIKYAITSFFLLLVISSKAQKADTAIVESYGGIPVFYNCKPLHQYSIEGALVKRGGVFSVVSQMLMWCAEIAQKKYPTCTGIIIKDIGSGPVHFEVIRDNSPGMKDTALLDLPIFFSAKPVRAYDLVTTVKKKTLWSDINETLLDYARDLKKDYFDCDGIIVKDLYGDFNRNYVQIIRWRK